MDDARNILLSGADKVGVNTGAVKNPSTTNRTYEIIWKTMCCSCN